MADPLKQGHHFDQKLGGIAGLFENIRSNTQVGADSLPVIVFLDLKGGEAVILLC